MNLVNEEGLIKTTGFYFAVVVKAEYSDWRVGKHLLVGFLGIANAIPM
jgi:hypothetical protein